MSRGTATEAFLLEIGTEEIPARMVRDAMLALGAALQEAITKSGLAPSGHRVFGTPRRLAALFEGVPARQEDREAEVTGPPVAAAFDAQGKPTKAAEGFARAQGVAVQDLKRLRTPKGECVGLRRVVTGRSAGEILKEIVPDVVLSLYFPKTMRWGDGEHRFVRPIHSIVALLGEQVVGLAIAGVAAGRETFGPRSSGSARISLTHASRYLDTLRAHGVLADTAERRARVSADLQEAARRLNGRIAPPPGGSPGQESEPDPELLDEVTQLVEWPTILSGEFDAGFLELPAEILMTSMRHHQKYFPLVSLDGELLNRFLAVANTQGDPRGAIRRGNEWVLRARLTDARFFHQEDRKQPLEAFGSGLERVAFHEKLGSYADKRRRIETLAARLAIAAGSAGGAPDLAALGRAAALCKNDLTTQMVKEFPELQGIIGGLYARADGLVASTAQAIYEHYLPASLEDPVPSTTEGALLSLADRLDTQAGIFLLGIVPTGSRDPYALRRSVQGACRILIEKRWNLSLRSAIEVALRGYPDGLPGSVPEAQAAAALGDFYLGRQEFLGTESGVRADTVRAALAAGSDDPYDARLRMTALDSFRQQPGFDDLAAAHKRIKNILKDQSEGAEFTAGRLRDEAEKQLAARLEAVGPTLTEAARKRDHPAALRAVAGLREPLDRFFSEVMVLAEDRSVRENRLALLRLIAAHLSHLADLSEIATSSDRPPAPGDGRSRTAASRKEA